MENKLKENGLNKNFSNIFEPLGRVVSVLSSQDKSKYWISLEVGIQESNNDGSIDELTYEYLVFNEDALSAASYVTNFCALSGNLDFQEVAHHDDDERNRPLHDRFDVVYVSIPSLAQFSRLSSIFN